MVTRRCAWCGASLPGQPGDEHEDGRVSHGICEPCLSVALAALGTRRAPQPPGIPARRTRLRWVGPARWEVRP
jgi:sarcosine oxidase gamma subunit